MHGSNGSKLFIPSLIAIIAMSIASAYALWSETLKVNAEVATGELDEEIMDGIIYIDRCRLPPGYGYTRGYDWNASYLPSPGALQPE